MKKKYFKLTALILLQLWTWGFQAARAQENSDIVFNSKGLITQMPVGAENRMKCSRILIPKKLLLESTNKVIKEINRKWQSMQDTFKCSYENNTTNILDVVDKIGPTDIVLKVNSETLKWVDTQNLVDKNKNEYYIYSFTPNDAHLYDIELTVNNWVLSSIKNRIGILHKQLKGLENIENVAGLFQKLINGDKPFECSSQDQSISKSYENLVKIGKCNGIESLGINNDQLLNYLELYFLSSLLNQTQIQLQFDEKRNQHFAELVETTKQQIAFVDSLIADSRLVNQIVVEKDKKTTTPNKEALAALIDRKEKLQKSLQEYKDSLKVKVNIANTTKAVWYTEFKVYEGSISLNADDNKHIIRVYDAKNHMAPVHQPNNPKLQYHRAHIYDVTILNLPGEHEYEIDTTSKSAGTEQSMLTAALDETPGMRDMLALITNWALPTITPGIITLNRGPRALSEGQIAEADNMLRRESLTNSQKEKLKRMIKSTDIDNKSRSRMFDELDHNITAATTKYFDSLKNACLDCACDSGGLICINSKYVTIPKCLSKYKDSSLCVSNCAMKFLKILDWHKNDFDLAAVDAIDDGTSKSAFQAYHHSFELRNFEGRSVTFDLIKNNKEKEKLESIYVSRSYKILPAVGFAYQWGYPYALSVDPNNGLQRTYQNKIALTAGIKCYPLSGGTRIYKEPLRISGNPSQYAKPSINNIQTKLYLYGGITISKQPYENLYFGVGIEPISGISIALIHRWVFENKIVVNGSQVFQVNGYSGLADPGAFGFSLLIDPVVVAGIFGSKNKEDKK